MRAPLLPGEETQRPRAVPQSSPGRAYHELVRPLHQVGAVLETALGHPGLKARDHLAWLARSNRIPRRRVDEVLEVVGLTETAGRRLGTLSLGMGQRLRLAAALLGDPGVLVLDERAVRSLGAALLLFVAISFLVAALDGWSAKGAIESNNPGLRPDFTATQAGLDGVLYGQLAVIVFGVLMGSCEYTSGLMPSPLLAVPRRGRLFLAKTLVAGAVTAALAVPVCVGCYLVTQTALGSHRSAPTVLRSPLPEYPGP